MKQIICKYDYHIYTHSRIIHLTNSEEKIPHLMGLQYAGKKNMYTGDFGAYAVKKGKIRYSSIEKLVRKYYKSKAKQDAILHMIRNKLEYLPRLGEMFSEKAVLYLFDNNANPASELKTTYLLVQEKEKEILQLGLVKSNIREMYHCNSFIVTFKGSQNADIHFRNLSHCSEIYKIVREEKSTKRKETIYQSEKSVSRELDGIRKMLRKEGIEAEEELVKEIFMWNQKWGIYHNIDQIQIFLKDHKISIQTP